MLKKMLLVSSALTLSAGSLSFSVNGAHSQELVLNNVNYTHPNILEIPYFDNEMSKALVDYKNLNEETVDHTHSVEIGDLQQAFLYPLSSEIIRVEDVFTGEFVFENSTNWEQKNQMVFIPAHSRYRQTFKIQKVVTRTRYNYLIPIENDKWCKRMVGVSGTVYQITPRELVAKIGNDSELLNYYFGLDEFYEYKNFIGQATSDYLLWAATRISYQKESFQWWFSTPIIEPIIF